MGDDFGDVVLRLSLVLYTLLTLLWTHGLSLLIFLRALSDRSEQLLPIFART